MNLFIVGLPPVLVILPRTNRPELLKLYTRHNQYSTHFMSFFAFIYCTSCLFIYPPSAFLCNTNKFSPRFFTHKRIEKRKISKFQKKIATFRLSTPACYAILHCNDLDLQEGAVEYNVLDFGAAGDGVTPDTHAIQATVDACRAHGGGRVVLFCPAAGSTAVVC